MACISEAASHNYLGCNWFIPTSYSQIADNDYRKTSSTDGSNTPFSSVLFSDAETDELQTYIEMDQLSDTDVVVVAHPEDANYSYKTFFIQRKTRLGDSISNHIFTITKDQSAVSMFSVPQADGLHMTSACVPPTVMEQHYEVLEKLEQGIELFLNSDHGLKVLVTKSD
ncbi:MAG: hypothetical protein CML20_16405 [Rheinheimera sp.]|nr:hypothetical protein [Rheinheimera sp.]